jgi:hypothetical protein
LLSSLINRYLLSPQAGPPWHWYLQQGYGHP